jgi:hypothetical protein
MSFFVEDNLFVFQLAKEGLNRVAIKMKFYVAFVVLRKHQMNGYDLGNHINYFNKIFIIYLKHISPLEIFSLFSSIKKKVLVYFQH